MHHRSQLSAPDPRSRFLILIELNWASRFNPCPCLLKVNNSLVPPNLIPGLLQLFILVSFTAFSGLGSLPAPGPSGCKAEPCRARSSSGSQRSGSQGSQRSQLKRSGFPFQLHSVAFAAAARILLKNLHRGSFRNL